MCLHWRNERGPIEAPRAEQKEISVKRVRSLVCCGVVLMVCLPVWGQAVRIGSIGSADHRVGIAVPDFVAATGLESVAKEMTDVMAYDLEFSGLFILLPRSNFPAAFHGFTPDPTQIDFAAWRPCKVTLLVYAYVTVEGDTVVAECRMFDVATGTQVLGQRLTSSRNLPRLVSHRFADEIVRQVDGVPGIATSEIFFTAGVSGDKEIYVADYDGANPRQLTQHKSISIKPKVSPDGKKIVYVSYKDRYPFLYILDRESGKSTPLSKSVGLNAAPNWAPDGKRLAYVLSKDGNTEIYSKNADGSGERRITTDRAADTSPTYDPTGQQIAFVSERGGSPQIYEMTADGGNVRRVSYGGGNCYDPVWSPDGKMIAYVGERSGEGLEIYVMNAEGGDAVRLTDTGGSNESPSWSADSRHVILTSNRTGTYELWAVNVQSPYDQHRIPTGKTLCEGPSWGPRR